MQVVKKIHDAKKNIKKWKQNEYSIGFVPTMGCLHEGHQSLIERSIAENDKTVVSIFVNPTQFSPSEDLDKYPRNFRSDENLCEQMGVNLIFTPEIEEMYPENYSTYVNVGGITEELCGKSRPTHFSGVSTIVNKLFNIVTPDRAYFGQKDAQQLAVIKKMAADLNMNLEIVGCPIIREDDGLAKSSRNLYLNPDERMAARVLQKALLEGEKLLRNGELNVNKIIDSMKIIIKSEPMASIDYIEIVDPVTIKKINNIDNKEIMIALAVYIGKTRLIDNFLYEI